MLKLKAPFTVGYTKDCKEYYIEGVFSSLPEAKKCFKEQLANLCQTDKNLKLELYDSYFTVIRSVCC